MYRLTLHELDGNEHHGFSVAIDDEMAQSLRKLVFSVLAGVPQLGGGIFEDAISADLTIIKEQIEQIDTELTGISKWAKVHAGTEANFKDELAKANAKPTLGIIPKARKSRPGKSKLYPRPPREEWGKYCLNCGTELNGKSPYFHDRKCAKRWRDAHPGIKAYARMSLLTNDFTTKIVPGVAVETPEYAPTETT